MEEWMWFDVFFEVDVSECFRLPVNIDEEKKNDNSIVAGNEPEGNKRREKKVWIVLDHSNLRTILIFT